MFNAIRDSNQAWHNAINADDLLMNAGGLWSLIYKFYPNPEIILKSINKDYLEFIMPKPNNNE